MSNNEILKMEQVINNLKQIRSIKSELKNEVISAFEDYDYKGVDEIIVEFEGNNIIRAYANHNKADIFYIEYKPLMPLVYIPDFTELVYTVTFVEIH